MIEQACDSHAMHSGSGSARLVRKINFDFNLFYFDIISFSFGFQLIFHLSFNLKLKIKINLAALGWVEKINYNPFLCFASSNHELKKRSYRVLFFFFLLTNFEFFGNQMKTLLRLVDIASKTNKKFKAKVHHPVNHFLCFFFIIY